MNDQVRGSRPIAACGWEMECVNDYSDKFYRVIIAGPFLITQYGRRSSVGTVTVKEHSTSGAAIMAAERVTARREGHGYAVSVPFKHFTFPEPAGGIRDDPQHVIGWFHRHATVGA